MSDPERDGPGEGASSSEQEPVPEVGEHAAAEPDSAEIDREFARIIEAWRQEEEAGVESVGPWPAAEDLDVGTAESLSTAARSRPQIWRGPEGRGLGEGLGEGLDDVADDVVPDAGPDVDGRALPQPAAQIELPDDDRYQPPDPPPLGGDLISRISWAAVLGGPFFLVFAVLFWRELPHLLMLVALAAFVGGFIALVARMPRERDSDDDDGAVV